MNEFFLDIIKRFLASTPKFFQVIRNVSIALAVITGFPVLLADSGVVLPESISVVVIKIVSIASTVAAILAQLTVVPEEQDELKFK